MVLVTRAFSGLVYVNTLMLYSKYDFVGLF